MSHVNISCLFFNLEWITDNHLLRTFFLIFSLLSPPSRREIARVLPDIVRFGTSHSSSFVPRLSVPKYNPSNPVAEVLWRWWQLLWLLESQGKSARNRQHLKRFVRFMPFSLDYKKVKHKHSTMINVELTRYK